jgi:hypothetical protein
MKKSIRASGNNIQYLQIILLIGAFTALLTGILIYALFRHSDLLVYKITGNPSFVEQLYQHPANNRLLLNFLAYNIPDGLWLLSGILFIRTLWLGQGTTGGIYILIFCFLAMLAEALQFFGIIPGTFDFFDVITMVSAAFGESVFYAYFVKRRIHYAD